MATRDEFDRYIEQGSTLHAAKEALSLYGNEAGIALSLFHNMTTDSGALLEHVVLPTKARLAYRIALGKTPEEAANSEYLYRWNLALQSPIAFGVPHALGM